MSGADLSGQWKPLTGPSRSGLTADAVATLGGVLVLSGLALLIAQRRHRTSAVTGPVGRHTRRRASQAPSGVTGAALDN